MRSALLWTNKSLAAYWLGSADSWKQLQTDETSHRQILWMAYVYKTVEDAQTPHIGMTWMWVQFERFTASTIV
jgi:hypothetical protein